MLNPSTITVIWWGVLNMELSDRLYIVARGVSLSSFNVEKSVVVFKSIPLCIDVVDVDGVDGVVAKSLIIVLKSLPPCLDVVDLDDVLKGVFY